MAPTLQQQDTSNTTGNPQSIGNGGLQQPATPGLQNTNNQAVDSLNTTGQSSSSISLEGIDQTTTASTTKVTVQPSSGFHFTKNIWLYGGLVIVVAVFMISLYYGLMRKK